MKTTWKVAASRRMTTKHHHESAPPHRRDIDSVARRRRHPLPRGFRGIIEPDPFTSQPDPANIVLSEPFFRAVIEIRRARAFAELRAFLA